ncbi:DUF2971 domain-containing protein [uncultured Roseovarius sp.]|uniref:DUF2971 domain-containing protein n=1 Tax=uncultured Roseovarius sp. TaxID=293344 RepID=UPI00262A32DF|nr:DUF2971 domain-containing protein [uncultured Roseovarius sp.]
MLVYKFYPPEYALQSLLKLRFKVSPIDELNDPFEYLSLDMGDKSVRAWAKNFRNIASKGNGIISFSKSWREPLMWAHYAKSHTGIALGFEVPDRLLTHINYITEKIIPPLDVDTNKESMSELVDLLLKSKHKNWEYEEEVRLVRTLQNCDEEDGLYFAKWNHVTMLKEVILGDRYQSKDDTGIQGVLEDSGVKFITARPEFKGFKMTPQKYQKLHKKL